MRSARNINLIDFKKGNFVLLGTTRSNPWVELFEPEMNFRFLVTDEKTGRTGFRNVRPRAGEKDVYMVEGDPRAPDETYSVVAVVPNLSRNGSVLMIGGATGEGTEAAGEFITNPEAVQQALRTMNAVENGRVRNFEMLLKSGTIGGASKNAAVVAYRLIPGA